MSSNVRSSPARPIVLLLSEHASVWLEEAKAEVGSALLQVQMALTQKGYHVVPLFVRSPHALPAALKPHNPARCVVFNWYEGIEWGAHDGAHATAVLDDMGFIYTGSGTTALLMTQDKMRMKVVLQAHGIPTPKWMPIFGDAPNEWSHFPAIVKVATEHGSECLSTRSVVRDLPSLRVHVDSVLEANPWRLMVSEFIGGREFAVSMWGNEQPEVLPLIEIDYSALPPDTPPIRTFEAKWGTSAAMHELVQSVCPTRLPTSQYRRISEAARNTYRAFGLRDYARIDMRMRDDIPQVIDINPNPDIVADSSFVKSASLAGYDYASLLDCIVQFAYRRGGLAA